MEDDYVYNVDKLRFLESDAVPKEGAKFENIGTSVKITHRCGCVLIHHLAAGVPTTVSKSENAEKYEILRCERQYHIELCDKHKKELYDLKLDNYEQIKKKRTLPYS